MSILKILGGVGKQALKSVIGVNLDEFKKGKELPTKLQRNIHEATTLVCQIVVSCIMLWKFTIKFFPKKSIEKEKQ